MFDEIDELKAADQSGDYPMELPNEVQLVEVEEQLLMAMPSDLRTFQLTVSSLVIGSLEPVTIADPNMHTYLPEVAAEAWSQGVPRHLIPICQRGEDYYVIREDNQIGLWQGFDDVEPKWETIWDWAMEVWLIS
ncbi:SMI1/KNR4 family protein [Aliagarivorans marinus]|uniref:SMI1/KNR4 family protein n=1 Tax=Aliagarivorans marinus TaxID=561965 RepID=UPI00042A4E5E|nr:SMI1/KNR4 family protein [Aliagarivorans marinus]